MNRFAAGVLLLVGGLTAGSCSSSSPSMGSTTPTPVSSGGPAEVVVTIVGMNGSRSFSPDPVTLHAGQAIAWKNGDVIVHQVVQDSSGGTDVGGGYGGGGTGGMGFDVGQVAPGATSHSITFPAAGTVRYHCAIHPTMTGTITTTN